MNDVCIQYQAENAGSIPASQQSSAVLAQYGSANVVSVRNPSNTDWIKVDVKIRNATWTTAEVAVRTANDGWLFN